MWRVWGCLELNFVTSDGDWRLEMLRKSSLWFEGFVICCFWAWRPQIIQHLWVHSARFSNMTLSMQVFGWGFHGRAVDTRSYATWLLRHFSKDGTMFVTQWFRQATRSMPRRSCSQLGWRKQGWFNRDANTNYAFFFRLKRTFWSWKHVLLVSISWLLFGIWN